MRTHPGPDSRPIYLDYIYLDYNATTPVDPTVVTAMRPLPGHALRKPVQRPPLRHRAGRRALHCPSPGGGADRCRPGRDRVHRLRLGGRPPRHSRHPLAALAAGRTRPHVITQATEHPAVLATCQALHRFHGVEVTVLPGVSATDLLAAVTNVAASTGSACHSGITEPSPVLTAMGFDHDRTLEALRLSLGRWTTTADIDHAAELLTTTADRLGGSPRAEWELRSPPYSSCGVQSR